MNYRICSILLLIASIFSPGNIVLGQWNQDFQVNNPVVALTGAQTSHKAVSDGQGGTIVVWADHRSTGGNNRDIYAQRISKNGEEKWGLNGIPVCNLPFNQSTPSIVEDGAGGAYILWVDQRNGTNNDLLYLQRVDSSGNFLLAGNGNLIYSATGYVYNVSMIRDAQGNLFVTWTNGNIFVQKIDAGGNILWPATGVQLSTSLGYNEFQKIISDGFGGVISIWERSSSVFNVPVKIYAQRARANGTLAWINGGIPVDSANGYEKKYAHLISSNNNSTLFFWGGKTSSVFGYQYSLLCQKVDTAGQMFFSQNGAAIINNTYDYLFSIISDGNSGAYISWSKMNATATLDLYMKRINAIGQDYWSADLLLCDAERHQNNSVLSIAPNNDVFVAWEDRRNSEYDIYGQKVSPMGQIFWAVNGTPVSTAVSEQSAPEIVTSDNENAIVVWKDFRNSNAPLFYNSDIYASKMPLAGQPLSLHNIDFTITPKKNHLQLDWSVIASGKEIKRFEIESSYDQRSFTKQNIVPAIKGVKDYSSLDDLASKPISVTTIFYRLKIVSPDDSYFYSDVKKVNLTQDPRSESIEIWPNPIKRGQQIYFNDDLHNKLIEVKNSFGQTVSWKPKGNKSIQLDEHIAPGTYFITVFFKNEIISNKKIIVIE